METRLVMLDKVTDLRCRIMQKPITAMETKILSELADTGATNMQLAELFGVAENTIKRHLLHLMDKTGAGSRAELIVHEWQRRFAEATSGDSKRAT